jgi:hypothetical protein
MATKKRKVTKKDKLVCRKCGLVLSIDNYCGCYEAHDVVCCGEKMKKGSKK